MGDIIQRKIRYRLLILTCAYVLLLVFAVFMTLKYQENHVDERMIRVQINQLLCDVEKDGMQVLAKQDYGFYYTIFDSNGIVTAGTMQQYPTGMQADLRTVGGMGLYMVPLTARGQTTGFALVDAGSWHAERYNEMWWLVAAGVIFMLGFWGMILYHLHRILQKEIWQPVERLHESTRQILRGNLEDRVLYDYDGTIGTLCHDFELMREEIRNNHLCELDWREKERIMYASISHDLKTPLAIVKGYLEEIQYGVVCDPVEMQETIQKSLNKIQVLNKMVADILEHSKAQLNQLLVEPAEVYAAEYFGKVLHKFQDELTQQQGTLLYQLPENVLVKLDENRTSQVLQNLIDNAVKYSKEEVHIQIDFERIVDAGKGILVVRVQDTGNGIEAADLPFIFEMFYRGNKARTLDIPGSGIGLHIAKYIVEKQGGRIECDSIVGVGTTMSFSVPMI